MLPVLGFCFSKKRVDSLSQALRNMNLISAKVPPRHLKDAPKRPHPHV